MTTQQQMIEESMLAQRAYLEIVRSRHHQWAYSAANPEIERLHLEIANLIQETMDQYYQLLNEYHAAPSQLRDDIFTLYPVSMADSTSA